MTNSYFLPKVKDWAKAAHGFRVELWQGNTLENLALRHVGLIDQYFPEIVTRLKDDWISLLVHMLRSSLQWVYCQIDWTQAVATGVIRKDDNQIAESFSRLRDISEHVSRQVERFELTCSLEYEEITQRPTRVDLARVIADAVKHFTWFGQGTNVHFRIEGPQRLYINCDERTIRIMIEDIIDNAVKYCFSGTEVSITFGPDAVTDFIKIAVTDCGLGIPSEEIDKVFDKHYRGHNRNLRIFVPGLGVGLTLCKRIAEEHGGTIRLESSPTEAAFIEDEQPWITHCIIRLPIKKRSKNAG
jgi:signal transduction histidine kinase